jgi:phosphoglycolate phosphatase
MLVVFDLDGTLVDSRRDLADAANAMLARYGGEPLDEATVGRMVGDGAAVLVERVLSARAVPADAAEALRAFLEEYDRCLLVHTRPYDGMGEALAVLATRARLAVLTNKPLHQTARLLEALGLRARFADVIGGDGPLPRKPHPDGLRALMRSAGVEPSGTVLVGDSQTDLLTARHAGTRLCLVRYGFGFESVPPASLSVEDLLVDAPRELPDRLLHALVAS